MLTLTINYVGTGPAGSATETAPNYAAADARAIQLLQEGFLVHTTPSGFTRYRVVEVVAA